MTKPVVYDYFNRPPKQTLKCRQKSRTQQQFLQESDINYIVRKYADTENFVDPSIPVSRRPVYGDFANCPSFQDYQNQVNAISDIFARFPSEVRTQFNNNPAEFAEFASDLRNLDKLAEMGLIDREIGNVNKGVDIKSTTVTEASDSKVGD